MPRRAAIVIGVDRVGQLTPLQSATKCAREVAGWLESEGYDVECLTDEGGALKADRVSQAFDRFVTAPPRYHQLVVYFTGHGYWHRWADIWLLSEAAQKTSEAINLDGAIDLARFSGIPNVIFISDACRSIPNSRSGQMTQGIDAFPVFDNVDKLSKVDVFRATSDATSAYEAVVDGTPTSVLTYALRSAFLEPSDEMVVEVDGQRVVPNRLLEEYLQAKIDATLAEVDINLRQSIDASVPSRDTVYIARVQLPVSSVGSRPEPPPRPAPGVPQPVGAPPPDSHRSGSSLPAPPVASVARDASANLERLLSQRGFAGGVEALDLDYQVAETSDRVANLLPKWQIDHFESECGFTVSGAAIKEIMATGSARGVNVELLAYGDGLQDPGIIRVWDASPAASVLLQLADGRVTVLAALAGYIGHVTVGAQGVKNVSYVPSSNHQRFNAYQQKRERVDKLRALVALAANENVFRMRSDREATSLADEIRMEKSLDPTLGLYAAHAYAQASEQARLQSVMDYMHGDLQVDLFDLRLLNFRRGNPFFYSPVVPFCPLLTQAWNLLRPRGVELPPALTGVSALLCNSLWTTFEPAAWDRLSSAITNEELT